jgi:D-beta-D-heptose 7-phosphate kinase/D-beta-D-heptose 1-phosphate adenosyltransferase
VAGAQQVVRADVEISAGLSRPVEDALLSWLETHLERAQAAVLSDYAKGVVTPRLARQMISLARAASVPVIVDAKGRDYGLYRGAIVVTPNLAEAERASGVHIRDEADVVRAGHHLAATVGGAVLITRGARGMQLFDPTRRAQPVEIPAMARDVFDVTGAGDTVAATVAMAVGGGLGLEDAARLATLAAGVVIGKVGTSVVTAAELAVIAARAEN